MGTRSPDFIVNDGKLFLIDFDRGGKEGEATFPRNRFHRDTRITKEHDKRVIGFTKWHINEAIRGLQNETK